MVFNEYEQYDALGLAELVRQRQVTPQELLDAAIARVEARDGSVNAVVTTMYDQARAAIAAGLPDGPFTGVPFMLKDLGVLYAGVRTANGSRIFADFVANHDSTLVSRYKAAGLVIAKTNTPGWHRATTDPVVGPRESWVSHSAGGPLAERLPRSRQALCPWPMPRMVVAVFAFPPRSVAYLVSNPRVAAPLPG